MALTVAGKLKIKEGDIIYPINPPPEYKKSLGKLPSGVELVTNRKHINQVHWFVKDKAQMEKELKRVLSLVKEGVLCWIFYPKGSSGIQTDLTRDKGWDALMKNDLQWVNLISFNETWSAFGMREKTETDKKRSYKPSDRTIHQYADSKTKTIIIPDDLKSAFKKNKEEEVYFNSLAFSHKREYIEWIVTAKKEKTRAARIKGTIERLSSKWKNPANR